MAGPSHDALRSPVTGAGDVERFLLALVRDDPRPYAQRAGQSLANVARLLGAVGHPQRGVRFAHIAGSKGKGSVALMLEALLRGAGLEVGTYTSPHLIRWNERVRIGGEPVSDEALVRAIATVQPHVLSLCDADPGRRPSFFDTLTVAALWLFRDAGCRVAVLECGLGGRFDATNAIDADASCITGIELEHTDKLGDTEEDIAWHKAGIAKRARPMVCAPVSEGARRVIERACRQAGAPLSLYGEHFLVSLGAAEGNRRRIRVTDRGAQFELVLGHGARHMAVNAALAVVLARRLGVERPDGAVLSEIRLPGRSQLLRASPTVLADGAHTPASLAALAERIEEFEPAARVFVVSVTGGKDLRPLSSLLRGAKAVVVTCADSTRSLPCGPLRDALGAALGPHSSTMLVADPAPGSALARGLSMTAADGLLCVCGSVYLAGAALRHFDAV